jgi:hypothetical protein
MLVHMGQTGQYRRTFICNCARSLVPSGWSDYARDGCWYRSGVCPSKSVRLGRSLEHVKRLGHEFSLMMSERCNGEQGIVSVTRKLAETCRCRAEAVSAYGVVKYRR